MDRRRFIASVAALPVLSLPIAAPVVGASAAVTPLTPLTMMHWQTWKPGRVKPETHASGMCSEARFAEIKGHMAAHHGECLVVRTSHYPPKA